MPFRRNPFLAILGLLMGLALACPHTNLHAQAPDPTRFESQILAYEAQDLSNPPPEQPIVFVGSSTIRMWTDLSTAFPDFPVINRGFGGSIMKDLLYYFDRLVLAYQPSLVLVYEGDNDLASGMPVEEVYQDYLQFVALMQEHLPNTDFGFFSVKPSPSRAGVLDKMQELNALLAGLAAEHDTLYIDTYTPMVDDDGNPMAKFFLSDNLHMNSAGYRLWRLITTPVLNEWEAARTATPRLTAIQWDGSQIVVTWEDDGQLEAAPDPSGPWTPITPESPGRHSEAPTALRRFFRLGP
ncbi:MAG: GDSL-type esterase/lipase family protein [Verrucomicrobiota bacterium]|nr:GDSL-type esterase/lipase family protein [Verrucomicrobiota bacterium]